MPFIFQGGVSFELHNKTIPHRFEVIITDEDKTVLWIEDLQSKKQWQTAALQSNGFVTGDNAIPKATIQDYAERFAACLGSTNASDKYTRTLTTKDLALDYTFTMNAVSLDRIDILGARVRDVEDKVSAFPEDRIRRLEQENEKLKAETQRLLQQVDQLSCAIVRIPVFAQATLAADHNSTSQTLTFFGNVHLGQVLIWFAGDGNTNGVIEFLPTGYIQFLKEGVYALDIAVVHESLPYRSAFIELKQSETTLTRGALHTVCTTTPLRYILKAKPNDKIHVLFNGPGTAYQVGSYITITKLN